MTHTDSMEPSEALPRDAHAKAQITNIVSGSTGPIAFNLIGGMIFTDYVLTLGLDREILGVIHSVAALAVLVQFVGAYVVERTGRKRATVIIFGLLSWLPVLCIFAVPCIPADHPQARMAALAIVFLLRGVMGQMCTAAWHNLMNDIVPANRRGRFWGTRSIVAAVSAALIVPVYPDLFPVYV